jgi:hypothetical protein
MAYNPHATTSEDRFPSGIVFFGASSTKPMLDSSSAFIIDEENNSLAIADGYYLGSQSYRQLLHLASDGTATFASGVIIDGNLTVNGDVVTVNTEQILVEDNVITLSSGNYADPSQDAGIEIYRGTNSHDVMRLLWNETSDKWTFTDTSGTYDLVGAYLSQELRYKRLDGNYNDFANIPNDGLSNSSITITAGTGLKTGGTVSLGGTVQVDIDLNDLPAGTIANGDSIAFIDANDGNATKKESIADIAALFAGNGLTATNSVINVAGQSGISATADYLYVDKTVITDQPINSMSIQNDFMLFYDANQDELAKITVQNLAENIAYSISGESITSFTLGDSFGNVATIIDGSAAIFNEVASGIETRVAANGTVSIGINLVSNSGLSFQGGELRVDESLINNRAELSSAPDAANDYLLIYDSSATALRKINRNNFVSGLGTMSSFTLAGDTGTNQTINNGNTVTIAGGTGLSSVGSNTDTVTINLDNTSVSAGTYGDANTIASFTVDAQGRLTGASGVDVNITASQVSDFNSAAESGIFTTANFVDSTRINFTVTTGASVTADLIANTISETYLTASVAGAGLSGGNGSALAIDLSEFSSVTPTNGDKLLTLDSNGSTEQLTDISALATLFAGTGLAASSSVISIDLSEYSTAAVGAGDSFLMLDSNGSTEQRSTVDQLGTYMAGTNITNTAGVLSVPNTTIEGVVFVDGNFVDSTTIDFTTSGGTSVTAIVKDASITEAKRDRTIVAMTSTGTIATTTDIALASNTITLTLPAGVDGKIVRVKNIGSGTVTVSSSSLIDGAGSKILYYQNESMTFVYYGSGSTWYVI